MDRTRQRPIFDPMQCLALEDIENGREYMVYCHKCTPQRVKAVSHAYVNERGCWHVDVEYTSLHGNGLIQTSYALSDFNVIPYKGDFGDHWNKTNYLCWVTD